MQVASAHVSPERGVSFFRRLCTPEYYMSVLGMAVLLLIPLASGSEFIIHVFVTIFLYSSLACAWNIVGGYGGQLSLGHATYYGIGGYAAVLLMHQGVIPWVGMLIGGVISMVIGVLISYPCFRLRGPFFALGSIAFLEVFRLLATHFKGLTGGAAGLIVPMKFGWQWMLFRDKHAYLLISMTALVLVMVVSVAIKKSRFGYYLIAVREREDAAMAMGINTVRMKIYAVAISSLLTSLLGSIHAIYISFIDPSSMFALSFSVQIAMFALIGGLGTVAGPLTGTLLVVPLTEMARGWLGGGASGLHGFVYGLVLVLVVLTLPSGIVGALGGRVGRLMNRLPGALPEKDPEVPPLALESRDDIPAGRAVLTATNISRRFGGLIAADHVNISLKKGEILGLIGPNGAGKTTVFNLISGFLTPDTGAVKIAMSMARSPLPTEETTDITYRHHSDILTTSPRSPHAYAAAGVGRTFQIVQPFGKMTVLENILIGAFKDCPSMGEARIRALQVARLMGLYDDRYCVANTLPIGALKRLEVARVLAMNPRILLLDEVMAGQAPADVERMVAIIRELRDLGITVIAIEHNMRAIMSLSDRILVISSGKAIADGTPQEIVQNSYVIEAYLGEEYVHA